MFFVSNYGYPDKKYSTHAHTHTHARTHTIFVSHSLTHNTLGQRYNVLTHLCTWRPFFLCALPRPVLDVGRSQLPPFGEGWTCNITPMWKKVKTADGQLQVELGVHDISDVFLQKIRRGREYASTSKVRNAELWPVLRVKCSGPHCVNGGRDVSMKDIVLKNSNFVSWSPTAKWQR